MATLRNVGKKTQSIQRPNSMQFAVIPPGGSFSGLPVRQAMKLQEQEDFVVDWEPEEQKDRDESGKRTFLSYRGPMNPFDGYGLVTIETLLHFQKYGIHVTVQQPELFTGQFAFTMGALEKQQPAVLEIIKRTDRYPTKWGLVHAVPPDIRWMKTPKRLLHTMWEARLLATDFMGVDWDYWAKQADAIIVPSSGQRQIFEESGCTQPIYVVPDVMELEYFPYRERPKDRPKYRFITWGRLSARKDPITMLQCFARAFPHQNDVEFLVKTRDNLLGVQPIPEIRDPRIIVVNDNWPRERLVQEVYNADAYVGMSHGEGWMVPPCLAAASGLPCVVPSHSGTTDWADPRYFLVCGLDPKQPYEPSSLGTRDGKPLEWWVQDPDQVIEAMRWCYENREKAWALGKKASKFIHKNFSVDVAMSKLVGVVNELD